MVTATGTMLDDWWSHAQKCKTLYTSVCQSSHR